MDFDPGIVRVSYISINAIRTSAIIFGFSGSAATLIFENSAGFAPVMDIYTPSGTVFSRIESRISLQLNDDLTINTGEGDGWLTFFHINSVISGAGALIKTGAGDLFLAGDNTFAGGLNLREGRLFLNDLDALGTGTLHFRGGDLYANLSGTIDNSIVVESGTTKRLYVPVVSDVVMLDTPSFTNLGGAQAIMRFGVENSIATAGGTIVLAADNVVNLLGASYRIGSATVRFGNAYSAAYFFSGATLIVEPQARLDTGGFATIIDNVNLHYPWLVSTGGAMNLVILRSGSFSFIAADVTGTAQSDYLAFHLLDSALSKTLSLADLTFNAWNDGTDIIGAIGSSLADEIIGSARNDTIIAGAGNDLVSAAAGSDLIFGEAGSDALNGGAGIDYVVAGDGDDFVDGGADADEIHGQAGSDTLIGGEGFFTDILVGGEGADIIHGDSGQGDYDRMYGNQDDDTFFADTPADLVFEQPGEGTADTVYADIVGAGYYLYENIERLVLLGNTPFGVGNSLDNILAGNAVGNYLLGGGGNDTLNGEGGGDVLFGEGGADVFVFESGTGGDVIGDFAVGIDRIDLAGLFATFAEAQLNFIQDGNVGAINLGNGDLVVLHNVTMSQLTATDFIFG